MQPFSTQTIAALTEIVTGGSGTSTKPAIGHYRSASELTRFFGSLNLELPIVGSRVPAVRALLEQVNQGPEGRDTIMRILEAVVDPRDYLDEPAKLSAVVEYLNKRLAFDGCELRKQGLGYRVVSLATNSAVASALDLESVQLDFERALQQAEQDPAGAITSACSTIESVCKCPLDELKDPYPAREDIKGLVGEAAKHLKLSQCREDLPREWEHDLRQILSGLSSVVNGIGALRTHAGKLTVGGQEAPTGGCPRGLGWRSCGQHCRALLHRDYKSRPNRGPLQPSSVDGRSMA